MESAMTKLLPLSVLIGLAACQSASRSVDTISATPPARDTGSMSYPQPGAGSSARFDSAPPNNPTGSMGYQGSGGGVLNRVTASPPKNPTGSMQYQE
jgi:hypothetical protein